MSSFSEKGTAGGVDDIDLLTKYTPELKSCGHNCCPSTVSKCCACADIRPVLEGDVYPCYVDGEGWQNTDARDAGYCPVCNPKNYEVWERKIRLERERKAILKEEQAVQHKAALLVQEDDRMRAAALTACALGNTTLVTKFSYSNGDSYSGHMSDGHPHGEGVMVYAGGEEYTGQWQWGKHHGKGIKHWGDGIVYTGEWQVGMMHGQGHYVMADGTEVTGIFAEDEFVE